MAFVEAQLHGVAKGSTAVADVTATTIDANHNGLDVNIVGGSSSGAVAQGSTTSGQTGSLVQGAVTTAAPAYTTGQTDPLSLTTAGALRVDGSGATQPVSGRIDAGLVTGSVLSGDFAPTDDDAMRIAGSQILDDDTFRSSTQNTAKFRVETTNFTISTAAGFNTNLASVTTINSGTLLVTRNRSQILQNSCLKAFFSFAVVGTPHATNTTIDIGLMECASAAPYAPTDGTFIRIDSTGVTGFQSVSSSGSSTFAFLAASGGAALTLTAGTIYDCMISMQPRVVQFWMDLMDGSGLRLMGSIARASNLPWAYHAGLSFAARHSIGGSAPSGSTQLVIRRYSVTLEGANLNRSSIEAANIQALAGSQGIAGGTMGSSALYTNSLAPGAGAAMTNTTAALGTGLGGQFACQPTLAANTDGILCSFQVPTTGSNTGAARTLVIDSIKISAMVTTAFTGGPVLYAYSAAWGHTAVSMATAESANTKAPRRKPLGFHNLPVTSAVGAVPTNLLEQIFTTDIVVYPGEFFAICAKNIGTVTSAGVVTFLVTICSHYI